MKIKFTTLVLVTVILSAFIGCTSLNSINSFIEDNLPKTTSTIPASLQEQIVSKINPENDIYAIGKANVDKSGTLLAQSKANKEAQKELKNKIRKEVKINLNSFMLNTDNYMRGIIKPVMSDIEDYAVDLSLRKAIQKGAWENKQDVYSLFVINRDEITKASKKVFTGYINDIAQKFKDIKENVIEDGELTTPKLK